MFEQAIDEKTQHVFQSLKTTHSIEKAYLAGGTALALELGHRISVDLDFFFPKGFSLLYTKETLSSLEDVMIRGEEEGTLHLTIDGVFVSFLRYRYTTLFPFQEYRGVSLADERDIACMKLDAISSRGSKKDFIDMFFLLQKYTLAQLFDFFDKKYEKLEYSKAHLLKSLVYFVDAEKEPLPKMLQETSWQEVKQVISEKSRNYLDENRI